MFDKFGEFDSAEEINLAAEGLFNEGDFESIKVLAAENGIDECFAEMYIEGAVQVLCDPMTAALGKIDIECAELKPAEIMADWVEYIKTRCAESRRWQKAVRRKGKTIKGCIGALLSWSFKNQQTIDKDIIKAAGVSANKVTLGIPGMGRAKKEITKYYLEG